MEPESDEFDSGALEERLGKWRRPLVWAAVILAILVLYLFAYPAALIYGDDTFIDTAPEWTQGLLYGPAMPLELLYDKVEAYELYINWLNGRW